MLCSLKTSPHISLIIELTYPSLDLFILPTPYLFYHPLTMVFTTAQITSFFEDADQCGLDHRTRVSLLNVEGITSMDDLADWEDDDWDRWATSCKKPVKVLTARALVEKQAFQLTVEPLERLKIASALVCYYESVSIPLTRLNMKWLVLK